ncbi:MAG: M48 family metalloprotease [Phycisphaerales bacterium]
MLNSIRCRVVVSGLLLGAALWAGACTTNATTGRRQFNALSREDEIAMGTQATAEIAAEFGGKVNSPELQAYVTEIGRKLASHTEADNPSLPWEFTLLNSGITNAFALPGGKLFITRGLADKLTSEAQMAGVLGHEVGHVTARHANDRIAQAQGTSIGVAVLGAVVGAAAKSDAAGQAAASAAGQAAQLGILLPHSRNQEYESDTLGVRYMTKAGYDPIGQVQVMQVLQRESGSGAEGEFFATHPYAGNRVTRLQQMIAKEYASTQNNPQFQRFEDRYRDRYLSKLRALPPAVMPKQQAAGDAARALAALGEPALWCDHCRVAAAGAQAR